ncbi:MAG: hypothetical protein U5K37_04030 [Natrialbaceae archaeon]|nr:hypothetical protein [Natrialbaceae archaeon]
MTENSTFSAIESSAIDSAETKLHRFAGILVMLTPVFFIAGIVSAVTQVPFDGASDVDVVTSPGWLLFWSAFTAGFVGFAAGAAIVLRQRFSGTTGAILGTLPLLQIPLSFVSIVAGWFVSRAIVRTDTTVAVPPAQQALVLDVMEAITDGLAFTTGLLFGFVLLALGYLYIQEPGRRSVAGYLGILLGTITFLVNLGLLLAAEATDLWILGILMSVLASFVLVPIGWFVYCDSDRIGHAGDSSSGTPSE